MLPTKFPLKQQGEVLFVTKVLVLDLYSNEKVLDDFQVLWEYLYLQIWKVLVLDSSTSKITWPQPWKGQSVRPSQFFVGQ